MDCRLCGLSGAGSGGSPRAAKTADSLIWPRSGVPSSQIGDPAVTRHHFQGETLSMRKHLYQLALVLALSATFAFAQTPPNASTNPNSATPMAGQSGQSTSGDIDKDK